MCFVTSKLDGNKSLSRLSQARLQSSLNAVVFAAMKTAFNKLRNQKRHKTVD